jgi:hypothetical protein
MGMDLPDDVQVERTHAGPSAKAAGAWTWTLFSPSSARLSVGGHVAMTSLMRAPRLCASRPAAGGSGYSSPYDTTVDVWEGPRPAHAYQEWHEEEER